MNVPAVRKRASTTARDDPFTAETSEEEGEISNVMPSEAREKASKASALKDLKAVRKQKEVGEDNSSRECIE